MILRSHKMGDKTNKLQKFYQQQWDLTPAKIRMLQRSWNLTHTQTTFVVSSECHLFSKYDIGTNLQSPRIRSLLAPCERWLCTALRWLRRRLLWCSLVRRRWEVQGRLTLWLCQNSYWKWTIEIVSFPIKNGWIFPVRYVKLPEASSNSIHQGWGPVTKVRDRRGAAWDFHRFWVGISFRCGSLHAHTHTCTYCICIV
jgi:hypothetical protein